MKIGIVGAGAAGLRAAMLLEEAGADVSVFEAKSRPGGRLWTIDQGDGVVYEAGGEWIDADHHRIIALLDQFGMEPESRNNWPVRVHHEGRWTTEDELWPDALEDDLRVEAAAGELCRELDAPPWRNTADPELDATSFADFVASHCHSDRGRWYVTARYRSDEGDDLERIGLLGWLSGFKHYVDRDDRAMSAYGFPGGATTLLTKIAGSLRSEPRYGRPLRRVSQGADGVTLYFDDQAERFDRVVLTLPPPALEHVVFEPALPPAKRCAVEACRMSRAIKLVWEFNEPWWRYAGWSGSMLCDRAIMQTWEGGRSESAILTAYICGDRALEFTQMQDPVQAGVEQLASLFPDALQTFERGWIHDWIHDPYSGGAFSCLAPGYVLEHMAHIGTPVDRIHFAGEHTSTWVGFIEGALESAERAALEVLSNE